MVLRKDIVLALEDMGIPVEYLHHEVGPSQHEIDIRYADALQMADHCMTYRSIVKEVAQRHGVYATFMPKPLFGENGSGMHTHQSLFIGGHATPSTIPTTRLSVGRGEELHRRAAAARPRDLLLFAQWVNSYKRLVPGYEAPVYIAWSRRNRSALIRVPLYHPGKEKATRARSAARTRPAIPIWRSPPCCTRGSRASSGATSCRIRWRRISTS